MSEQRIANDIDAALFDLADRCLSMAEKHPAAEKQWHEAASFIGNARSRIRTRMSERDRKDTQ